MYSGIAAHKRKRRQIMFTEMMMSASGGGTELNPTAIKEGYITASGNTTQTIDTSKTYIVAVSGNYSNASAILLDTYKVEDGIVTAIYDSSAFNVNVTVSGTTLTITNPSSAISISYTIIQLD